MTWYIQEWQNTGMDILHILLEQWSYVLHKFHTIAKLGVTLHGWMYIATANQSLFLAI